MAALDEMTERCEAERDVGYSDEEKPIFLGRPLPGPWLGQTVHAHSAAQRAGEPEPPAPEQVVEAINGWSSMRTWPPSDRNYLALDARVAHLQDRQERMEEQLRQLQDALTQSVEASAHWKAVEAELDEEMRQAGIKPADSAGSLEEFFANAYPFTREALDRLAEDED